MATENKHDYVCVNNDEEFLLLEGDTLNDVLDQEEKKNEHKRKRNVRKAIDKYLERKRLKQHLRDFDVRDSF